MCGLGSECSMVNNPLHITTDGVAGSPAAGTLEDRSTNSVDMHDSGDGPGPHPDAIRTRSNRMRQDILIYLLPMAAGVDGVDT